MGDWYQKNGDYPYTDWHDLKDSSVYPATLWSQVDGDYPYRECHDLVSSDIYPDSIWKQTDGDYPFKGWHDVASCDIYPNGIWVQKQNGTPQIKGLKVIPNVITYPDYIWKQKIGGVQYKSWAVSDFQPKTYPAYIWLQKQGGVPYKLWAKFPKVPTKEPAISKCDIITPNLIYHIKTKGQLTVTEQHLDLDETLASLEADRIAMGIPSTKTKEDYGHEYNLKCRGNVDYNKRPFLTPQDLIDVGWDYEGNMDSLVTTYDLDYHMYDSEGNIVYTVKLTPVREDGEVFSPSELDSYFDMLNAITVAGGEFNNVLDCDLSNDKLIISILNGETQYDENGLSDFDKILIEIKEKHALLKDIEDTKHHIGTVEAQNMCIIYNIIIREE